MIEIKKVIILIILYFLFSIPLLIHILNSINKEKKISLISFFKIYYLLYFGIIPIITILNLSDTKLYFSMNIKYYYLSFFISTIFYILFHFFSKINFKNNKINNEKKEINVDSDRFFYINLLISVIGFASLLLWTKAYGNPWNMIEYGNLIRSGNVPIFNKYTFLKPLCVFSLFGAYNCLIARNTKFKILNKILLLLNLFSSVMYLLCNDGRASILIFIGTFILYKINKNININVKQVFKYSIIVVTLLLFFGQLDNITYYIRNGKVNPNASRGEISEIIIDNFSYVYRNNINIEYLIDTGIYSGSSEIEDLKGILFAWVPTRYKTDITTTLLERNTSYYMNATGTIPSDIITSSLYKFSYLGIIIMALFISFLLKKIQSFFEKFNSKYTDLIYNYLGFGVCMALISSYDMGYLLFNYFALIISFMLITFFCKNKQI